MAIKTLNRSFAAGEIAPQLFARLDLDKYQTGLALLENAWALPQGPIQNRPGFAFVNPAKDESRPVRLIPFSFSTEQTYVLEFSHYGLRFHTYGGTVLKDNVALATITSEANATFSTLGVHGLSVGRWLYLTDIPGMPGIGQRWAVVTAVPTTTTFKLRDLWTGQPINTTAFAPTSGQGAYGEVYEIATPFHAAELFEINYVQSADVMTLVHPYHPPCELRRLGHTNWSINDIQFSSSLAPPQTNTTTGTPITHRYAVSAAISYSAPPGYYMTALSDAAVVSNDLTIPGHYNVVSWQSVPGGILYHVYKDVGGEWRWLGSSPSASRIIDDGSRQPQPGEVYQGIGTPPVVGAATVTPPSAGVSVEPTGGGTIKYRYAITSRDETGIEESIAATPVETTNDLGIAGNYNTIKWPAVPGVKFYGVYKWTNGIYGFIGRAGEDCTFVDNNIISDTTVTPPLQISPFVGDGNYPRAVSYHEQRRVFGGSLNLPQTVWMTRSGTERNMGYSQPARDDDSIVLRVVSREANTIRHMVPSNELILLTSGGEWKLASADGGALSPSTVSVKQQGYSGASGVPPVVTNRTILFAEDRGGHLRELQFSWQQQGYQTQDISLLAPHLFDYRAVRQMAFARAPVPMLWAVRSDGVMLGMTYVPEQEVRAWHHHTTDGVFESCCVVAEDDDDVLYAVVRRTINGSQRRYIERLHARRFSAAADQFFVDSGATYVGTPASTISGLQHLEGKTVSILADGGVSPPQVVMAGKVTLDAPASKVHIGLPYTTRIQTLPLAVQTQAFGQGTQKNVNKVHLRVLDSNGWEVGPDFSRMRPFRTRSTEPYGSPPELVSGEFEVQSDPSWNRDGAVCIQQKDPISLMVLGMTVEFATGG